MASHGYVVVSVDHNGFNKTQSLPDGSSVVPDALTFPQPTGDLYSDAVAGWEISSMSTSFPNGTLTLRSC